MNIFKFSGRQAAREWRSGELKALAAALLISTAALVAVGSFIERVEKGLKLGANELLGADLVIRSRQLIESDWADQARQRGLDVAQTVEFPSVGFVGDRSQLMQVKAVTAAYPLRGQLQVSDELFGDSRVSETAPDSGEVWVDSRVLGQLKAKIGDQLELGDRFFDITAIIVVEPDRASGVFDLAPRVMMNWGDVAPAG